jgi:dienelactone hydrolase
MRFFQFCKYVVALLLLIGPSLAAAETLRFKSTAGESKWTATISGDLRDPGGKGPFPVVIFLHPCGGLGPSVVQQGINAHASALRAAGFATFVIDSFSARRLNGGKACGRDLAFTSIKFMLDDAFNARAMLAQRAGSGGAKMFLVGQSLGATAAVRAAAQGLHTHSPAFDAVAAYYPDCRVPGQGGRLLSPLLIFGGGKDDWLPAGDCVKAKERNWLTGKEYDVVVYADALHAFDQPKSRYRFQGHWLGYDAAATADSRKKMVEFFVKHRGSGAAE